MADDDEKETFPCLELWIESWFMFIVIQSCDSNWQITTSISLISCSVDFCAESIAFKILNTSRSPSIGHCP
jgi:hypothetical protein